MANQAGTAGPQDQRYLGGKLATGTTCHWLDVLNQAGVLSQQAVGNALPDAAFCTRSGGHSDEILAELGFAASDRQA